MRFLVLLACLYGALAGAVPLQTYDTYTSTYPSQSRKGQFIQLLARGIGTNDMYVMEVDPTTGAIPVSATITFNYDTDYGVVGANTLRTAAQIGNSTGEADFDAGNYSAQTLRTVIATDQPPIPVTFPSSQPVVLGYDTNYGAVGSSTLRTASQIGNSSGAADFGSGTRSAQTLRVTVATDDVVPVSQSGTWTTGRTWTLSNSTDSVNAVQSGTWNINNITGTVSLPTGAATAANQATQITSLSNIDTNTSTTATNTGTTATNTGLINGKLNADYGASSGAIRTAAQVGNASGVADFGTGTAGAQTLRVVQASNSPGSAGRSYADSAYLSYSSTNITTGAWVELIASTAATINSLTIFSSCGETLELGTGAAASETRKLLVPPGGLDGPVGLAIASGTRISLKGVSGNCTSGQISLTGLN